MYGYTMNRDQFCISVLIITYCSVLISLQNSLRTQTYFRLSLGSAENSVCEPEPENDFCDVGILSQSQFSSNYPKLPREVFARVTRVNVNNNGG